MFMLVFFFIIYHFFLGGGDLKIIVRLKLQLGGLEQEG